MKEGDAFLNAAACIEQDGAQGFIPCGKQSFCEKTLDFFDAKYFGFAVALNLHCGCTLA
jgi:hypothetical protein